RPHRGTIRFFVKNEGRQPCIVAGAIIKWKDSAWNGGMPLQVSKGLPVSVSPGDRSGQIEGEFTVWDDELALLMHSKRASVAAFTPTGDITDDVEFPVYGTELFGVPTNPETT